jgi:NAD(P)-dependent dehydrogenase (short-subunit alcohol dehydrogenase family)
VIDLNLTGTFIMSQCVYKRAFEPQQHGMQCHICAVVRYAYNHVVDRPIIGVIVNVIANMWNGFPLMAHTGAARAGVDNLTKTLAVGLLSYMTPTPTIACVHVCNALTPTCLLQPEWSSSGVRVNAVAPGTILSSGLDRCNIATHTHTHSATHMGAN